jgi:hypothetical protein
MLKLQVQRQSAEEEQSAEIEATGNKEVPRIEILRPTNKKIIEGIFHTLFDTEPAAAGSALIMTPDNATRIMQDEQIRAILEWENPRQGLFHRRLKGKESANHTIHWEVPDRMTPEIEIREGAAVAQDTHTYSMVVMPGMNALESAEGKGLKRELADWKYELKFEASTSFDSPTGRTNLEPWGYNLVVEQKRSKFGDAFRTAQLDYWGVTSISPMMEFPDLNYSPDTAQ